MSASLTPVQRGERTVAALHGRLEIRNLQVIHGGAIEAIRDVSIKVESGQIVALPGSNGRMRDRRLESTVDLGKPQFIGE